MKITKSNILYAIISIVIILLIFLSSAYFSQKVNIDKLNRYVTDLRKISGVGIFGDAHYHADIAIYINGKKLDLQQKKYQLMASHVHLENGEGEVIHVHVSGLTVGHFLNSIGFRLTNSCLKTDFGEFCNDDKTKLKFYINGKINDDVESYIIKDLDKILISYGSGNISDLEKQLNSLTDLARGYSKK